MRKKAIFLASAKGGVGKTMTAKALLGHLRKQTRPDGEPLMVAAFDTDPSIGQLARAYGIKGKDGRYDAAANRLKPTKGVAMFDARVDGERIPDAIDAGADIILVDLPGGLVDMSHVFGDTRTFLAEFEREGYEVIFLLVISQIKASAASVLEAMKIWGAGPRYVVVKNLGFAAADQFLFFDGAYRDQAGDPAGALANAGGSVIELPGLDKATFALFDAWETTVEGALDKLEAEKIEGWRPRRGHLERYLAESDEAFESLRLLD